MTMISLTKNLKFHKNFQITMVSLIGRLSAVMENSDRGHPKYRGKSHDVGN